MGVFFSAGIGGLICYFGVALAAGLSVTWRGILGAAIAAFGFVWLVSKATEKPADRAVTELAWLEALAQPKDKR